MVSTQRRYGSFGNTALTLEEKTERASERRLAKLRNPYFQSLLSFVSGTPHLSDQVEGFQKRKDMLLDGTESGKENHRELTPLLAGIASIPEARAYLQIALDEAAKHESDRLKFIARADGSYYTPVLVLGAGVHGSIFNSQLLADRPDVPVLTVDQGARLGGTFRMTQGPAFRANSRNRAERDDLEGLPGKPGSINSLGRFATMQVSDLSLDVYADNDKFGLAVALNQWLSGYTMLGVRVKKVELNESTQVDGIYKVTLKDLQSGKKLIVTTDIFIGASGLGGVKYNLGTKDKKTAKLLDCDFEEEVKNGRLPQLLPSGFFLEYVGDRSVEFPLEPFVGKRVAVTGGKDSGNIDIEELTGLGPEYRGSVAQMGRPAEIVWYGPDFRTKEEYEACARTRYSEIGLFLPKTEGEEALIRTISERVNKLRKTKDGKIKVISSAEGINERAEKFDYVILATGFEDQRAAVFKPICGREGFDAVLIDVDEEYQGDLITVARKIRKEAIYFVGPSANIPIEGPERRIGSLEIPENSAAIWRYGYRTSTLATLIGMELPKGGYRMPNLNATAVDSQGGANLEFSLSATQADRLFPPEINYANLLKIQALAQGAVVPGSSLRGATSYLRYKKQAFRWIDQPILSLRGFPRAKMKARARG
jgi:hypothetical protein